MYINEHQPNDIELNQKKLRNIKLRAYLMEKDNLRNPVPDSKMINQLVDLVKEVVNAYQED